MRRRAGAWAMAVVWGCGCSSSQPREGATQAWTAAPPPAGAPQNDDSEPMVTASAGTTKPSDPAFEGTATPVEKKKPDVNLSRLKTVRTGSHEGYDRVVLEFDGVVPGYRVEYIDKPIRDCGSGDARDVPGRAFLRVAVTPAAAHTDKGAATIKDRQRKVDLPMLRGLSLTCDFEGRVEWVLGVEASNRYRVLELVDPPRLVIDLRHKGAAASDPD